MLHESFFLPSQLPPLQPSLPIGSPRDEGEDSDNDVETEVLPLVGRGVAHTLSLLKRDAAPSGAAADEIENVGAGNPFLFHLPLPAESSSPVNKSCVAV